MRNNAPTGLCLFFTTVWRVLSLLAEEKSSDGGEGGRCESVVYRADRAWFSSPEFWRQDSNLKNGMLCNVTYDHRRCVFFFLERSK
jgi:hypothetical protein